MTEAANRLLERLVATLDGREYNPAFRGALRTCKYDLREAGLWRVSLGEDGRLRICSEDMFRGYVHGRDVWLPLSKRAVGDGFDEELTLLNQARSRSTRTYVSRQMPIVPISSRSRTR